jgi:NTE family protein
LALNVIGTIRTDLDAFSDAEIAVLENHGYQLADIAVQTHVPNLVSQNSPPRPPHPDWIDEAKVRAALEDSSKTFILGRW